MWKLDVVVDVGVWMIWYPFRFLVILWNLLVFLSKPLWVPLYYLFLPVVPLAQFVWAVLALPLQLLRKLETLYIFLAQGAFIGIVAGFLLFAASSILLPLLGLEKASDPQPREPLGTGTTMAEYRAVRRLKKKQAAQPLPPPEILPQMDSSEYGTDPSLLLNGSGRLRLNQYAPLHSQTILEEDDSEH